MQLTLVVDVYYLLAFVVGFVVCLLFFRATKRAKSKKNKNSATTALPNSNVSSSSSSSSASTVPQIKTTPPQDSSSTSLTVIPEEEPQGPATPAAGSTTLRQRKVSDSADATPTRRVPSYPGLSGAEGRGTSSALASSSSSGVAIRPIKTKKTGALLSSSDSEEKAPKSAGAGTGGSSLKGAHLLQAHQQQTRRAHSTGHPYTKGRKRFSVDPRGDLSLAELQELKRAFADPLSGIPRRNKRVRQKTYKQCFVGSQAVDWLVDNVAGLSREKAVDIGVVFWASGLFRHVKSPYRPFSDGPYLFRFKGTKDIERDRKKAQKIQAKRKLVPMASNVDNVLGISAEDTRQVEKLKSQEGWLDVQDAGGWVKRWCIMKTNRELNALASPGEDHTDLGWSLLVYEELVDSTLSSLVKEMIAPKSGLKIKTRVQKHLLKGHKKVFRGKKAIDWLLANNKCDSKAQALAIMNSLLLKGLVRAVTTDEKYFRDGSDLYRFQIHSDECKEGDSDREDHEVNNSADKESLRKKMQGQPTETKCKLISHRQDRVNLTDCMLRLERGGGHIQIVIYRLDNKPILYKLERPQSQNPGLMWLPVRDESAFALPNDFIIRVPEKDDAKVKGWIFALEYAIALGSATATPTVIKVPQEEFDSQYEGEEEEESEPLSVEEEKDSLEEHEEATMEDELLDKTPSEEEEEEIPKDLIDSGERAVLAQMKKELQAEKEKDPSASSPVDWTAVPDEQKLLFLRARKLEVRPAIELMKSSIAFRKENNLLDIKISDVGPAVTSGMLRLIPDATDKQGRVLLYIMPQYYNPSKITPMDIVRGVMYLLDTAMLHNPQVQRSGFSIIVGCKNSKYSNFDPKMPKPVIDGIVSKYPGRVGHIIITDIPWFFRFIWIVIRPLLSEALASKFHIVAKEALTEFVDASSLLAQYGGSKEFDPEEWIAMRHRIEGIPYSASSSDSHKKHKHK